jgi:UDP-N-acetyl-D-mannosaminuronic acid dehydrogenase
MIELQQQSETQLTNKLPAVREVEKFKKVLVIGLGQLGLPVAKYILDKGFETFGFDVSAKVMKLAKTCGIKVTQNFSDIDVFVVCISTHKQDDIYSPDVAGIVDIARRISNEAKNGALVSIESTIPKGTSRRIFEMMNNRVHVVHVPHRWYALEQDIHGVNQLRVIGGVSECCLKSGLEFYGTNNGGLITTGACNDQVANSSDSCRILKNLSMPLHPVSEIEIAELAKIVENSYRYVQIAFAEDLNMYCHKNNVNFNELRKAVNTKWNVSLPEARNGIDGHCLPKDAKMFVQDNAAKSKIVTAAMEVDADFRRDKEEQNLVVAIKTIDTKRSEPEFI